MYKKFTKTILLLLLATITQVALAQQKIRGRVTESENRAGFAGVNILEKGSQNSASTDVDGNFTLNVNSNATLEFLFIGYVTQSITVGNQTTINIVMVPDVKQLSEIVIVGYGEVNKKDATGAVVDIPNRDFNKGVLTSPQDLMVGKFAGVAVTSSSGAPGAANTIRIHGGASLNAVNDPLIVIDGFPVDNTSPGGVTNPLASIHPNDIETFIILKDASATAIYGSRASNGVILVTTKKGSEGKTKYSYNQNVSVSSPIRYVDVMNASQYRDYLTTLSKTPGSAITSDVLAKIGSSDTNWQKEIFINALSIDHNINASGTVKTTPYRVSYGYTDQQEILRTTSLKRHSLNLNASLDWEATLWLSGSKNAKFRADDAWDVNWGSAAFPTGTGTQGGANIAVNADGYYKVMLNTATGAYTFTKITVPTVTSIGVTGAQFSWNTDFVLTRCTTDANVFTGTTNLTAGDVKFRANAAWANSWGGGSYPSGYGGGNNITIPTTGDYFIYFNLATGEYFFAPTGGGTPYTKIGIIGTATTGGWTTDTQLVKNPSMPYRFSTTITLTAGDGKFRAEEAWTTSWGNTAFPSGVGSSANGPNIPVTPAGKYVVKFHTGTGEYSFTKY